MRARAEGTQERDAAQAVWEIARRTARLALDAARDSVYSPACLFEGLRAMRLGAAGATARELDAIVGSAPCEGDWLGLEPASPRLGDHYVGRMVTGVWLDEKAAPGAGFEADCEAEGLPCMRTDLEAPEAGAEISRWVTDATEGLVSPAIELDARTLACVASALCLKDGWQTTFWERNTERAPFHAEGGDVDADFMVEEMELPVDDVAFGTLVRLPLSNGSSMVLAQPAGSASLSDVLSEERLFDAIAGMEGTRTSVELHMPKFTCETTVDRTAALLSALGLATADHPDLSRMTGAGGAPVSYSHGARIAVDENGLEAGAYFAVAVAAGLPDLEAEPPKPRMIVLDRPFLYVVESRTGIPLFVGTVARPEADRLSWIPCHHDETRDGFSDLVIFDEEIPGICRITLEENYPEDPLCITCVIHGFLTHERRAARYEEAMERYEGMKRDLLEFAQMLDDEAFEPKAWCDDFARTWA